MWKQIGRCVEERDLPTIEQERWGGMTEQGAGEHIKSSLCKIFPLQIIKKFLSCVGTELI